ncbi:MAG: FMN-binding protein [Cellulosilyticum sp.]|nr:FMN-binding protein [Cellulosilyticum sp.]
MKKILKIMVMIPITLIVLMGVMFGIMTIQTKQAVAKQVNVPIDMNQVADGFYEGSSDGGLVQVQVIVEVKDHQIKSVEILKHENGKGKPAEIITDDMVAKNTYDVDAISGATTSSQTIINAVNMALQKGINK